MTQHTTNEPEPTDESVEEVVVETDGQAAEVTALQAEMAELKDRLLRSLAEVENMRRRTERDVDDARKYAVTGFARDLIEVADNLARALQSIPAGARESDQLVANLATGVDMTQSTLLAALTKHHVRRVEPERGEKFDHNRHQAMYEVPTGDLPPGTVAEVMQPGYVIADRLLRPAMVGVAKAPASAGGPGQRLDTEA